MEGKIIAFYRLDDGVRLLPLEELNTALEQQIAQTKTESQKVVEASQRAKAVSQRADREAQRARDLEAQIAVYQQRLGELPIEQPNLLE